MEIPEEDREAVLREVEWLRERGGWQGKVAVRVSGEKIVAENLEVGMIMRRAMMEKGMTLRELSKATGIGVVSLSEIERDCKPDVSKEEVTALWEVLGWSFDYLLDPDYRVRAREKWNEEDNYFRQLAEARKRIVGHNTMDVRERCVVCPRCKRKLHYTVHYNGHIWAKCETEGCLCWME